MKILIGNPKSRFAPRKIPTSVILSPSFGRRTSRNISGWSAPSRLLNEVSRKSQDIASTNDGFSEVLRPKEALRMTGLRWQSSFQRIGIAIALFVFFASPSAFSQNDKFQGVV